MAMLLLISWLVNDFVKEAKHASESQVSNFDQSDLKPDEVSEKLLLQLKLFLPVY